MRTKLRRSRGYLLLEAAIAGGVLTVSIGVAMVLAATFRAAVTGASRRAEAAQIAEAALERYAAGDRPATFGPDPVVGHRDFFVSGTAAPASINALGVTGTLDQVTVVVQYPVSGEPRSVSLVRWVR